MSELTLEAAPPDPGGNAAGATPRGPLVRLKARAARLRAAFAATRPPPEDPAPPPPPLAPREELPPPPEDAATTPESGLVMARADWADKLWDAGFCSPGGAQEALRLSSLLPLSPATTLLMMGQDSGGAAAAIASRRGCWIAFHQHDRAVAAFMASRLSGFGKRIAVQPWTPEKPAFRANFHHHALGLEPLLTQPRPGPFCEAVGMAIKSGGQFVLVEVVQTMAGGPDRDLDRWLELEGRRGPPPPRAAVEAALQEAGFQVHVAKEDSQRHCAGILEGFARLVPALRDNRPKGAESIQALLAESEAWLLRHRLISTGRLALLRWHASRRISVR
ncbi:hypothetical protein [Siccirubricoccus phaeus]|uniref:hypothetical protein n=1 Tax=Siccirubricoccus phaeus TaxID=2595053 RepID=UPI0011F35DCE|nr:hypothetical protein [Siccirubricoccus phaeus]